MKTSLKPFMAIAAVGLVASLIVHFCALLKIPNPFGPFAWGLHIGIFIVWLSAVLVLNRTTANVNRRDMWKAALRGCPHWMRSMVYGFGIYAFINFAIFFLLTHDKNPKSIDAVTTLRGFSGHWMVFYSAALAIMYSATKISDVPQVKDGKPFVTMGSKQRLSLVFIFVSIFTLWGFGWDTVGRRLMTDVDGVIVVSRDVPSTGGPRYSTEYTFRSPDGKVQIFWAGPNDGSLARSMPVGTRIHKIRWHLGYERNGQPVGFPYIFYSVVLAIAIGMLVWGISVLFSHERT